MVKWDVFALVNYSPPHSFHVEERTIEILIRVERRFTEHRDTVLVAE